MQRVRKQLGCSDAIQNYGKNSEVTVAVLDTGIAGHPDFGDRIIAFKDFVHGVDYFYDDSGHGTHVAGCIGGNGYASGGRYKGIAPECKLCVAKVLDKKGEGSIHSMYNAIEWVMKNSKRLNIRVLNISVGMGNSCHHELMGELLRLIDEAWKDGLVVVCAAGNNGPSNNTISPLGTSNSIITVGCNEGGYFGERKDLCEHYSGRGGEAMLYRKPDLVAPGTDIVSCNFRWRKDRRGRYFNAYTTKSGTSMSTPIVAGAAALLLQKKPSYNNMEVKRKMIFSAANMGASVAKQGWGMLDIGKLFQIG